MNIKTIGGYGLIGLGGLGVVSGVMAYSASQQIDQIGNLAGPGGAQVTGVVSGVGKNTALMYAGLGLLAVFGGFQLLKK
jgi:hypothetical protein